MRKNSSPSKLLGLKQEDMAAILGVTRSHYAMFESGQRDLPTPASLLLNEILAHLHAPESAAKARNTSALQQPGMHKQLEVLLRENQYQQQLNERKLAAAQRKHEAAVRRGIVMEFLASRHQGKKTAVPVALSSAHETESARLVLRLDLKKEALEVENLLLQGKLRKLSEGGDFAGDSKLEN